MVIKLPSCSAWSMQRIRSRQGIAKNCRMHQHQQYGNLEAYFVPLGRRHCLLDLGVLGGGHAFHEEPGPCHTRHGLPFDGLLVMAA